MLRKQMQKKMVSMIKQETEAAIKAKIRYFEVSQAFEVELPSDRVILSRQECARRFFDGPARLYKDKIGCYIFSLRTGRGSMPYYVGRTWNSFEGEIFQSHKVSDHYQSIIKHHKGTPTFTFVSLVNRQGPKPETVIQELESHLIRMAYTRNPRLSNKQGLPKTRWEIKGVTGVQDCRGAPTKTVCDFKNLLGY